MRISALVKNKLPYKRRPDLKSDSMEMVCVEICPAKANNTIFSEIYKPPNMEIMGQFMKNFEIETK